jgi:hypothetical protein
MFGRKKEKPMNTVVNYYDGIPGFSQEFGCMLVEDEGMIYFKDVVNKLEAKLSKSQIISIDFLNYREFIQKYKFTESKKHSNHDFCIFTYESGSGEVEEIIVSGTPVQILPVMEFRNKIILTKGKEPKSITL